MFHLLVFAKEPRPTRVKTRLMPLLGATGAARLYAAMLRDVATAVGSWPGGRTTWVVDGDPDHPAFRGREVWPQGTGDLGDRLERAVARGFREGARTVGVIGTDCPLLGVEHLGRLFASAGAPRTASVIPAEDGGYVALALGSPCPAAFRGIAWSTPAVLSQTIEALDGAGFRVTRFPALPDVDTPEDLAKLREALRRDPRRAPHTARELGGLLREIAHPVP
ncbi:MAG: glycosyltransferase [Candidatus Dadabacteria bacterium]|nr:MAG: glycosyltransferase [Candidatus Dadabacteria bacterium]